MRTLDATYQVNESGWGSLVASLLAEIQETLASLGRPGRVVVANLWLLATEIAGQALDLDRVSSEPKELLLETSELSIS